MGMHEQSLVGNKHSHHPYYQIGNCFYCDIFNSCFQEWIKVDNIVIICNRYLLVFFFKSAKLQIADCKFGIHHNSMYL